MAKKKKAPHKKGSRVGKGAGKIGDGAKIAAGAVVGALVMAFIDTKMGSTIDPKIRGGVELAGGAFGAYKIKASPLVKGLLVGVSVYGGLRLASGLGVVTLTGIGCADGSMGAYGRRRVAGFADVPAIGNTGRGVSQFPSPAAVGSPRTRAISQMAATGNMY